MCNNSDIVNDLNLFIKATPGHFMVHCDGTTRNNMGKVVTALTCRWRRASFEECNKNSLGCLHHLLIRPHPHTSCLVGIASASLVEEDPSKKQMMVGQSLMVFIMGFE